MAVTGGILVLFLLAHMFGNLKVFYGAESFDHYAHWLRTIGEPAVPHRTVLTLTEVVLALSVVLHIWAAVSLTRRAHKARPEKYRSKKKSHAQGYAIHIMRYGGVTILLFVIWHLLDMTFLVVNGGGPDATPYERVVEGFDPSRWPVTAFYVLAVLLVGLHLRHGIWSAFQTLGVRTPGNERALRFLAAATGAVITVGFISVPLAVTFGWVN
jgi:succinate dehydrogenase / fumarate reductase cytochrome b subunit